MIPQRNSSQIHPQFDSMLLDREEHISFLWLLETVMKRYANMKLYNRLGWSG